ncbi:SoxR reducing system RseC family protein [bacterium]|nr:SoxR reducing system RseC family protein [bacterium]
MIIKQCGKVIEKRENFVVVQIAPDIACKGCDGCAQSKKSRKITVRDQADVNIGDSVEIEIDSKDALKAGFILFMLPVIGLLAGVLTAIFFIGVSSTSFIVVSGFIGAFIPVFFIKKIFSKLSLNRKIVKNRLSNNPACNGKT